ncbi:MAG: BatA domain-containing protein [Verrucomicrobiota bacterium]
MPLFFSSPAAAWLLSAIALPVIFHLFFRLRRQVRDFPALMFFARIDPRLSAKRKIHEWVVLLLRCLFLALLLLALLRPILGTRFSTERVARLVLVDNSGSMAGPAGAGESKLALTARATGALLDAARPGDVTAVQVMLPDPTATLPGTFDAPSAVVRDALGKLEPTDAAAPVARAIRLALATLDSAKAPRHELHILTDLQKTNWSRGELAAEATNCRIIVHRIASAPVTGGSVSLEAGALPARPIPAGRITPVRFVLRNHGPAAGTVRLNSADDSGRNSSREIAVPANASLPVALTFSFATPGFHWAQVWLEGDAAPAARRTELGFLGTDVRTVVFAGDKAAFGALPYAVAPGGNADLSGINTRFVPADQLVASLADPPLAVAVTWDGLAQNDSPALADYVRQGGTLLILPAPDAGVAVGRSAPSWLGAQPGALVKASAPEPVVLLRDGDPFWQDLRDADGRPSLGSLRVFQEQPLQTGDGWETLIASARGAPLLARRTSDRGQIFASGLAFTPAWSSLPLKGAFVVLVQNAVFGAQAGQLPIQSIRAGDDFRFDAPGATLGVKSLAGAALDWHGLARDFAGFPRAGVYAITQDDRVTWAAVSANVDEADPQDLPLAPVPLLRNLPHDVVPLAQATDITRADTATGGGTSLYRWLLIAALLVLLAETWLANERSSDLGLKLFDALRGAPKKAPAPKATAKPSAKAANEGARV